MICHPAIRVPHPHRMSIHANHFPTPSTPLAIASVHLTVQEIEAGTTSPHTRCHCLPTDLIHLRSTPRYPGPRGPQEPKRTPPCPAPPEGATRPSPGRHVSDTARAAGRSNRHARRRSLPLTTPLALQPSRFRPRTNNARQRYQPLLSRPKTPAQAGGTAPLRLRPSACDAQLTRISR